MCAQLLCHRSYVKLKIMNTPRAGPQGRKQNTNYSYIQDTKYQTKILGNWVCVFRNKAKCIPRFKNSDIWDHVTLAKGFSFWESLRYKNLNSKILRILYDKENFLSAISALRFCWNFGTKCCEAVIPCHVFWNLCILNSKSGNRNHISRNWCSK